MKWFWGFKKALYYANQLMDSLNFISCNSYNIMREV